MSFHSHIVSFLCWCKIKYIVDCYLLKMLRQVIQMYIRYQWLPMIDIDVNYLNNLEMKTSILLVE